MENASSNASELTSSLSAEQMIAQQLALERARLEQEFGLTNMPVQHFRRPAERPFTAEERGRVTILFGGLTWKHDQLIQAVFEGAGYRSQRLPTPDLNAFHIGKQFGNTGQCNPAYFTVGNLIRYLRGLEVHGVSHQELLDNYVFFTAGTCGPCRFGMYESEYRMALKNAGFEGFRVLLFKQGDGIRAQTGEPGLKFTVDVGMGALNALNLGDIVHEMIYRIRPYETTSGETDRVFAEVLETLARFLQNRRHFEILESLPKWFSNRLARKKSLKDTLNTLGKVYRQLYGEDYAQVLQECRERIRQIEVDRLRVKPIVKITGEFWAQTTEGDGNFNMFAFLEREGAQVLVDGVANWIMYLLRQAKANARARKGLDVIHYRPAWYELTKLLANELKFHKKQSFLILGERIMAHQYKRAADKLGHLANPLVSQAELARLADPFYHTLAQGGEGHQEVGKNVYYSANNLCHMVLALKPFGCLPSSQSDGVQSAVVNRFPEMIFLSIETSGEGEINAHSRVQMALGEAKTKAKLEFQRALAATGKRLDEIKTFVAEHSQLRDPLYPIPQRRGIAAVAANFVLHVNDLMTGKAAAS